MSALQTINLGTAPAGTDGDPVRTAFGKVILNVAVLNTQATLTSSTITTARALVAADMGKRIKVNLPSAGTLNWPKASTCGPDQVITLLNTGATVVSLATTTGSGDTAPSITTLSPGDIVTYDTDGVSAWSVLSTSAIKGASRVLASVAALRTLSKFGSPNVFLTGYYVANDGAGGEYVYDPADTTTADNGGTVIVAADGGRWKLVVTGRVSIKQFGAKGDDVADDTTSVNSAITWAVATGQPIFVPTTAAAYRLTNTINITGYLRMSGESCFPTTYTAASATSTHNPGSWFHIDHAGIGFKSVSATSANQFLVSFTGIGTIRNQPTPGAGAFTPAANDWDFYCSIVELYMDDVFCLNPTQFCFTTGGPAAHYKRIRGQPLTFGIWTDFSADCCNYDDFHFWPFWAQQASVYAWTQANLRTLHFGRADTPFLSNLFSIFAFAGISFTTCTYAGFVGNVTSGMKANNLDFDSCTNGLLIEGTSHGVDALFTNYRHQGPGGAVDSRGVYILPATSNALLRFENFRSGVLGAEGIRVDGTNNFVYLGTNTVIDQWNQRNAGWNAINCIGPATGNKVFLGGPVTTLSPTGSVTPYGGGGTFKGVLGTGVVTTTTNTAGLVTVTHNLGATPTGIMLTLQTNTSGIPYTIQVVANSGGSSSNATSFSIQVINSTTGVALNTGAVSFLWMAVY